MDEKDLVVIKSRNLMLRDGIKSSEVLLVDPTGGDMFFTFELKYIANNADGHTNWTTFGPHNAAFVIDVRPNAITRPQEPILIGTYGNPSKPLYLNFVVQPQIAQTGEHETTVIFCVRKEGIDGTAKGE